MCARLCRNDLDCIQCTHMSNKYSVLTTNDDVNVATDTCVCGAMCCDLNAPLFLSQYKVLTVPGDGYCFLHAISMSMKSQLNISHDVSSLLNLLHSKVMSNYDQYLSFLENPCPDTFSNDILNHIWLSDEEKSAGLALDDTNLEQVVSCPHLGVHVDQHLEWDGHILNLCKKISQKLAVLCRLRKVLSKRMLCQQYLLCIQPCIDYAISVWGSCSEQNKALISRLQHRAARIVTGNFDFINVRGADLLKELWQSLNTRRDYYTATLMYKCINEVAPIRLINEVIITADVHSYPTRAAQHADVQVPKPNIELYRQSFKYRAAVLWNDLPQDIKNAPNIDEFKYLYKKHFSDKCCDCTWIVCVYTYADFLYTHFTLISYVLYLSMDCFNAIF